MSDEEKIDSLKPPKKIVAASCCVTNERGEILLVKTYKRSDTWEMPGGQVEIGEAPHQAALRETFEETGIVAEISGISGVYCNLTQDIVTIVFRGKATGGSLRTSEETQQVSFVALNDANWKDYVTRPHVAARLRDAMNDISLIYEAFESQPYRLLKRWGDE